MSDHIRRLELIGHATWPSLEDEWLGGWLLRAGGGVTRRANSASPVHHSDFFDFGLDRQIARCEEWFEHRGLPPIFRLSELADPAIDAGLEGRGYEKDRGAVIMTRPVVGFPPAGATVVSLPSTPSESWLDLMAQEPGRGGTKRDVLASMLARIEMPAAFAGIEEDGRLLAIGLGVVADGHVALFMMRTEEDQRRRGLAKTITAALVEWGVRQDATHAFLQVHPANATAIALYRSLGFEQQYEYWYRQGSRDLGPGTSQLTCFGATKESR